jgi:predicted nucleic acid-binding Zn ribbon protein
VNESECDFCGQLFPFLIPINDGAWAICPDCYASAAIEMPVDFKGEEE